jgi:serine/threonine protein kinase
MQRFVDELSRLPDTPLADRYVVEREVGRGGMATVYLARDLKHRRKVAVKVLNSELATAVGPERFLREIETAARLSHPHILPLYDSGHTDDILYYVMPFVEGESLQEKLAREEQLTIDEAVRIAHEVADALAHAHRSNVVHRDIKPANILLLSNHAVVSDFGVALVAQAVVAPRLTVSGIVLGTPLYMSPEQASGQHGIDGRSDIYSLGCVLYEMLTGEPPFTGSSANAILSKKLLGPPPPLRIIRDSVGESLEHVTLKALSRTAADRFSTAAEFAEALEAAAFDHHARSTGRRSSGRRDGGIVAAARERNRSRGAHTGSDVRYVKRRLREERGRRPTPLTTQLAIVGAGVLLPTAIGFLTTTVYDQILGVPHLYTPSRTDFPIIGIRALIPGLYVAFLLVVMFVVVKQIVRLTAAGVRRFPQGKHTLDRWKERSSSTWQRVWSADPGSVAEIWFVLAVLAAVGVLAMFVSIVRSAEASGASILSCDYRDVHKSFTTTLTVLIVALASSWSVVFRHPGAPRKTGITFALTRWGGIALIFALVLVLTAPWRVLWTAAPRVRLHGERHYILRENDVGMLLYNPRTKTTVNHRISDIPRLERLNTSGYIFEDEQAFTNLDAGC